MQAGRKSSKRLVFISHYSAEKSIAVSLKKVIEEGFLDAIEVFVSSDGVSIPKGSDFPGVIRKAIDKSVFAITLISHESMHRPWVNIEFGAFWSSDKLITPLLHGPIDYRKLDPPYNTMNGARADDEDGLNEILSSIARTIEMRRPDVDWSEFQAAVDKYWKQRGDGTKITQIGGESTHMSAPDRETRHQAAREVTAGLLGIVNAVQTIHDMSPSPDQSFDNRRYSQLSEILAEAEKKLRETCNHHYLYLPDGVSGKIDLILERCKLVRVTRELARRGGDGLSSRNRKSAKEYHEEANLMMTTRIPNMCRDAIEIFRSVVKS